uniref:Uncharacterized protein n=1 Tax=Pyrodinium bahamense TaxID=73915 RepID=A0A7S0A5K0_9DINO|mmetsp:Transcript_23551/g.65198  ORF Transcript_23551/g.65198 Transcript_23551/m.65198 type:complete len:688 (+) Transcript_23551:64-2127(+)
MKAVASVLVVLALGARAGSVSPIGKVIQLISDVQSKIVAEGQEAQKVYEEFAEFCEDRSRQLGFDIKTGKAEAADLKASISKSSATIGALNAKMEELSGSISTDEADLKAATYIRGKEHADFVAEEKELMDVIDMLGRAIGILEREMAKGGASMLQVKNAGSIAQALEVLVQGSALSAAEGAKLTALVQATQNSQDDAADAGVGAPDAAVYDGHSGDIIATMENLMEKAQAQLASARKAETSALHTFELLKQSLEDEIAAETKDMDEAKKTVAATSESKATAQGDLSVTLKDLEADTASLADLHQECMTKAQDFEAATKSRGEEIKAVTEAKKVLVETTGASDKITYGLSQVASFVQLSSGADLAKFEAVRLIRDLARQHHSSALAQLATRAAAAIKSGAAEQDPFAKVKGLISDMIAKLEDEADADATHKAYCDKELSETEAKKADKDAEIEKLTTKIEQMAARSAKLKKEVAALQKSLAELASAQAEMDKLRKEENTDYVKNKADMEQGLEGVKLALKVLRDYYGQASDAAHTAATGAGSSIIGLLEVVESDLSKTLAGIVATEEEAQSSYEAETKENEVEKTAKEQDVKYKVKEAAGLDKAISEHSSDRAAVQQELDAVMEYLGSLNKECTEVAETYAERKARREAEIEGLKQALATLETETALLQRLSRRALRGPKQQQALAA